MQQQPIGDAGQGPWQAPMDPRLRLPSPPFRLVARPRLDARLADGTNGPLTLVSAPAGTGKTVAVAQWVASGAAPGPVTWVSADDGDLTEARLWPLLVTGLHAADPSLVLPAPPGGAGGEQREFLFALAAALLGRERPAVLVIDAGDAIPTAVATALDVLLRHAGDRLRIVLAVREDPPLPLYRYRVARTLTEVRAPDLAFSADEARELLLGQGLRLPEPALELLVAKTEGWAAGLVLAGMALADRDDVAAAAADIAGDTATIADYLIAEVLDAQPPAARQLLLETSVVAVLRPGLAESLAGPHASRALSFLVHGNAFIEPVASHPGSFRYHPLFRELLQAQLAFEEPDRVPVLHSAAAAWLAAHGELDEAVEQAVAAGQWAAATRYVVEALAVPTLLVAPTTAGWASRLRGLPASVEGPYAALVRAALALDAGDVDACRRDLTAADDGAQAPATGAAGPALEVTRALVQMVMCLVERRREEAWHYGELAGDLVPRLDPEVLRKRPEVEALAAWACGCARIDRGAVDAAAATFRAVPRDTPSTACAAPAIDSLGQAALVAARRGELRRATALAEDALELQDRGGAGLLSAPHPAHVALAWVAVERCDLATARRHMLRATEADARLTVGPFARAMLAMAGARTLRARRELDEALHVLADDDLQAPTTPTWLQDEVRAEITAIELAAGRPERAVAALAQVSDPDIAPVVTARARLALVGGAAPRPRTGSVRPGGSAPHVSTPRSGVAGQSSRPDRPTVAARVDSALVETAALLATGDERSAAQALDHALRTAATELLRRPFEEAPAAVRALLRRRPDLAARHPWLGPAGRTPPMIPAQRMAPDVVEPLTHKEREVLALLSELLTTEEIAGSLVVSVNTVRTHVRSILRKLGATRRNEAVRRARDLGLLTAPR